MSVKLFGIFLAYAPTIDLRNEGLGRYLAAFLKGAAERKDVRFVLVCPSWTKSSLDALFEAERVPQGCVDIKAPENKPPLLRLYEIWLAYRKRSRRSRLKEWILKFHKLKNQFYEVYLKKLAEIDSFFSLSLLLLPIVAVFLVLTPLWLIMGLGSVVVPLLRKIFRKFRRPFGRILQRFHRLLNGQPKDDNLVLRMFRAMRQSEESKMLKLVNDFSNVEAWYCPTPFWPVFNKINKPRLLCVPDVVLSDFPVGFSKIGGDRILDIFSDIEDAVRGGSDFVTYSDYVKFDTLINRYAVKADKVTVVRHAPSELGHCVSVRGLADERATSINFCKGQFLNAIFRSSNYSYVKGFDNADVKFIFYASQLRPNKNIITLLRAYKYLISKRFICHKLILTGDPSALSDVSKFISEHRLQDHVLCLHGLKMQELAACYKLADLAVNPSLSEGGCPFTFTEALSVDTPVVMARIAVTEEVLTDPELQEMTFFDPYDWQNMAERIEWALAHRDDLLAVQRRTYTELSRRTWADVVNEHLVVLEKIAQQPERPVTDLR